MKLCLATAAGKQLRQDRHSTSCNLGVTRAVSRRYLGAHPTGIARAVDSSCMRWHSAAAPGTLTCAPRVVPVPSFVGNTQ